MNQIYRDLRQEILRNHAINGYRHAELRPLRDKCDLKSEVKSEYKEVSQQLSDDSTFPYEIKMWHQGRALKGGYKPLNKE